MKHYIYCTGIVILTLCTFVAVNGRAHVQVLLKSYTNVHNTIKDTGKCCKDSSSTTSCASCDPYIEMYIAENPSSLAVNISNVVTTGVYSSTNVVDFSASHAGFDNPFSLSFATFKNSIMLVFRIHDKSSGSTDTANIMDKVQFDAGHGEPTPFASTTASNIKKELNGTTVSINFEYMLQCDSFYYGGSCETYCKAKLGQYSCSSKGKKQCETGWSGTECDHMESTNPCISNSCQHGSTCVSATTTYTCACGPMFTGTHCETELTTTSTTSTPQPPVSTSQQMDTTSNSTSSEQSRFLDGVTKETLFAVTCSVAGILLVLIISVTVVMCRMYNRWKISDVKSTQKA